MSSLDISVVISTRNRQESLRRVLDSATLLHQPDDLGWELIVVDNGSSDESAAVARSFEDRLPIRVILEPTAGLSYARNRGVAAANGKYIVWTDDDVTLDPAWLGAYHSAFKRYPEAVVFGGAVTPVLQGPSPAWILTNRLKLRYLLAERQLSGADTPIIVSAGEFPIGANFAVRAEEQRQHLYDVELGASPAFNRLGEEEQVLRRILSTGATGWWLPGSRVNHHIPLERQTLAYVEKYARAGGETWAFLLQRAGGLEGRKTVLGVPHFAWRRLIGDFAGYRIFAAFQKPSWMFSQFTRYAYFSSAIHLLLSARRSANLLPPPAANAASAPPIASPVSD